jgi:hypothetical protein
VGSVLCIRASHIAKRLQFCDRRGDRRYSIKAFVARCE